MGGNPCRLKIILNGARTGSNATHLAEAAKLINDELLGEDGYKIVAELNAAEDAVDRATRILLESQAFKGPWPHSLMTDYEIDKYRRSGE